ncbi:hypothetical protein AVEN_238634-1 [Araneus ventricosus]|uniref:Uncharacterized protein n=1 Tax=Araneus ventricosus TaxID=182803 RepID=A0A4Y2VAA5_ARAVE|nr:hypothetical protein AVEN_238634-1 [Araneus ventricosus]
MTTLLVNHILYHVENHLHVHFPGSNLMASFPVGIFEVQGLSWRDPEVDDLIGQHITGRKLSWLHITFGRRDYCAQKAMCGLREVVWTNATFPPPEIFGTIFFYHGIFFPMSSLVPLPNLVACQLIDRATEGSEY